jgi:hypothetical protein
VRRFSIHGGPNEWGHDHDHAPAVGHTDRVDFVADNGGRFVVQLVFDSGTSMTYTGVRPDGTLGSSETVRITVDPVRDPPFLVSWQESDGTTVVHLEDYQNLMIVTHITSPGGDPAAAPSFSVFHGR